MKQTATLKYLKMAPRKVRLMAGVLRGLSVNEAEAQLVLQRKRAAKPILKLLRSAVANARATKQLDPSRLVIESIRVDQGPMLKRYLPRARGSASPIQKKMSHIFLVLAEAKTPAPVRFKIAPPKRTKSPKAEKKDKRKEVGEKEKETSRSKPGFFKRTFNRKAI